MSERMFLTGSRAYGAPREDSDWDLVAPGISGAPSSQTFARALPDPPSPPLHSGQGSHDIRSIHLAG